MTLRLMSLRRAAPWLGSLLAHALLVLLVPLGADLGGMREPVLERRVVLAFDEAVRPAVEPAVESPANPSIAASELPMPSRPALTDTPAVRGPADAVLSVAPRVATASASMPSAREILDTLPPISALSDASAVRADAAAAEPTIRTEWSGKPREPVRKVKPRFPTIFSTIGQEASVEARITVTPLGAVIDVEITRSSGYTDIDAAVESALRQWLYNRIEGKQNQIGTVYVPFTLEKRD